MKLALIIFIGFCAISAQAYPSYDESARLGLVTQPILKFVAGLRTAVQGLNKKVEEVIASMKDIIKSIMYQGIQKASDAWAKVDAKLEAIKQKGDKPRKCVEKYSPAMKDAKTKMDTDNKQCIEDLTNEAEKVKSQLEDGIKNLFDTVKQFYGIIDECASFNPIKSAKCIRDHMGQFKDFIMNTIHSTEEAINDIRGNITEAAKTGAICTKNSVVEFGFKQTEITGLIHDCMQEELSTVEPTVKTTSNDYKTTQEVTQAPTLRTTTEVEVERTTVSVEKTTVLHEDKTTPSVEKTTDLEKEKTTVAVEKTTDFENERTTKDVE